MKLSFPLLAASAAVLMVSAPVLAGPPEATPAPAASPAAKTAKAAKAAVKKTPIVCAVTGETIEDIPKSAGTSVYKGKPTTSAARVASRPLTRTPPNSSKPVLPSPP